RSWEIIRQNIWPLVSDNICGLSLDSSRLDRLRRITPAILCNCPKLRSIDSFDLFPELTTEDNANASSAQAVGKWLITPRGDGLPKMFDCGSYLAAIEGLKRSFYNASEPVNFIIPEEQFDGERLTLRQIDKDIWLLVRCPIGREEDKWANWEKGAIGWEWFVRQWNLIIVSFTDGDIGDGMVEANEGPSEPPTSEWTE
uniref:Calpain catalytic domain-containing protein n=1 Tax=Globodera pallida TaxID=36090 RepID=A0A183CT54_GLOPA